LRLALYKVFSIQPQNGSEDPFHTNSEFCLYDETHNDYVYQDEWVNFIIHFMQTTNLTPAEIRGLAKNCEKINVDEHCN